MEDLSRLIQIVSKHKLKNLEIVGNNNKSDSLLNRLYFGIHDQQFNSDEEAARALYKSTPDNKNYKKLKYQLEKRLINTVFFIDLNEAKYNAQQKAVINCNKNFAAVQILMARGARSVGIRIAENTLRAAVKYEYTYLVFELSRVLYEHYTLHSPNAQKKKRYRELLNKQKEILEAEVLAEEYHSEIKAEFVLKKGAYNDKLALQASEFSLELKSKFGNISSKKFLLYSNSLHLLAYQLNSDHENVIKASQKAVQDFKKLMNPNGVVINQLRILSSYITIKKYKEAKEFFLTEKTFHSIGGRYWFVTQELKFIFYLHTREYQEAFYIFSETVVQPEFKKSPILRRETWKVYEAYIYLFIEIAEIVPVEIKFRTKKFKLNKFLNDIPILTKDKSGLNIQVLILQVVFLLKRDKIDHAINRMQVLHQYAGKYLKNDYTFRSNVFIKMLIVLIRNQMHREAVIRKSAKYLKMLKDNPIEKSKQSIGIEVVPFEDLWELIIADTRNEFRFTPAKVKKIEAAFGSGRRKKVSK